MLIVEDSYLLKTPLVAEHMSLLTAAPAAYSIHVSASCTLLVPSAAALASHSQYLALCDGGSYYHSNSERKILSELTLLWSRSSR
jgi:hypothetical protein